MFRRIKCLRLEQIRLLTVLLAQTPRDRAIKTAFNTVKYELLR